MSLEELQLALDLGPGGSTERRSTTDRLLRIEQFGQLGSRKIDVPALELVGAHLAQPTPGGLEVLDQPTDPLVGLSKGHPLEHQSVGQIGGQAVVTASERPGDPRLGRNKPCGRHLRIRGDIRTAICTRENRPNALGSRLP